MNSCLICIVLIIIFLPVLVFYLLSTNFDLSVSDAKIFIIVSSHLVAEVSPFLVFLHSLLSAQCLLTEFTSSPSAVMQVWSTSFFLS